MTFKTTMKYSCLKPSESTASEKSFQSAMRLNDLLDHQAAEGLINEPAIEGWLKQLQADLCAKAPCYWLLLARLTELTIVCAGRYADACEFAAAGDLIVNPRHIQVHFRRGTLPPMRKRRHGALSVQFNKMKQPHGNFIQWFKQAAIVEIVKAPLLTFFLETMETSQILSTGYLDSVRQRISRITETLGFLSSWNISDASDFYQRLAAATAETRRFVLSHLCDFDLEQFDAIGRDVRKLAEETGRAGDFLNSFSVPLQPGRLNSGFDPDIRQRKGDNCNI